MTTNDEASRLRPDEESLTRLCACVGGVRAILPMHLRLERVTADPFMK